jgi:predicted nucleotidyltransferase
MTSDRIVLKTICGSHMWKMNHAGSDTDYWVMYAEPTESILDGTARILKGDTSFEKQTEEYDVTSHEASHVVSQLLKGNINFICGAASPVALYDDAGYGEQLRNLVLASPSKAVFDSIDGMAKKNFKRYVEKKDEDDPKKWGQVARVVQFGITLLQTGKFEFHPYVGAVASDIEPLRERLKLALEASTLPERPDPEPFREWLLRLRLDTMRKP